MPGRSTGSLANGQRVDNMTLGVFAVLSCVCVVLLFRMWRSRGEWKGHWKQARAHSPRITRAGLVTYGLLVVALFAGIAAPQLMPDSFLGRWVASEGFAIYLLACFVAFAVISRILELLGFPSIELRR